MPPLQEAPRALDFLFSEANGGRSRERVVIAGTVLPTAVPLMPGTLLYPIGAQLDPPVLDTLGRYAPVTASGLVVGTSQILAVNCILGYVTDNRDGDVEAMVFMRDIEFNDAYIMYALALTGGAAFTQAEINAANASLRNNGIIARTGVLSSSLVNPPIEPAP
jgi:hypothetical protein